MVGMCADNMILYIKCRFCSCYHYLAAVVISSQGTWLLAVVALCPYGKQKVDRNFINLTYQMVFISAITVCWIFEQTTFFPSAGTSISSLCYSPSDIHLMVGLSTGEVQVNGVNSSICIFSLGNLKVNIM